MRSVILFNIAVQFLFISQLYGHQSCCLHMSGHLELQIIERSLPKKPKLKKDPSVIEKEEMDKIGKYWINLVRKEIPKHHKTFINFHRKQLTDAKRFSETCQREVSTALILLEQICVRFCKFPCQLSFGRSYLSGGFPFSGKNESQQIT